MITSFYRFYCSESDVLGTSCCWVNFVGCSWLLHCIKPQTSSWIQLHHCEQWTSES